MPDSKITALASTGTGTDPANDPLVIVDVSDTSMAATGTTKKVTLNNLLACSPTATLASATITGAATVGTTLGVTGAATFTGAVACNGAVTLGDAVGDAINVTGNLTAYTGQTPSAIRAAASDYAAVTFDGATASTRITSTLTGQNIGTGDFSVWARFRVPALAEFANNPAVIGLGPNAADGSGNSSCRLNFLSGGTLSFRINDAGGATTSGDIANFSTNFSGQVVDVVVTRTGSTLKIYINGTDTAYTGTPAASTSINSVYCHTGIGSNSATVFTGRIYRSVVFNRALSASDVTELITVGVNPADQWGTQTQVVGFNPAVLNGGFETNSLNAVGTWGTFGVGTSTATIDTSGSFSRTGSNAGKLTLDALASSAVFSANNGSFAVLALGKRYRISIWGRKGAASGSCGFQFGNNASGQAYGLSGLVLTTSYANTLIEVVGVTDGSFSISRQFGSAALSEIYIDDVEVTRIGAIVDLDFTIGGGTTAFDRSTNGLDGTLFGGVSWTMPLEGQYINGPSTITGDLTVDTSTLKVDSTNNRVGIVNASPAYPLDVTGIINSSQDVYALGGRLALYRSAGSSYVDWATSQDLVWRHVTSVGGGGASTLMTLNSTGLGVGVASPSYKLDVLGSGTISGRFKTAGAINALYLEDAGTTAGSVYIGTSGNTFRIITGSNVSMNVDASSNVGIGVTPSAWTSAFGSVLQFKSAGSSAGGSLTGSSADNFRMFSNTYYDGAYKYIAAGFATQYEQSAGSHVWYLSGTTAGAINGTVPFSTALSLDKTGSLVLGSAAVATTATDGFLYIPSCAGAPTGVPTAKTGRVPMVVDSTNNRFYVYVSGTWKYTTLA